MSGKIQHVRDSSVAERRLRPIYDWLDNGNNKKALQECDKVLKKTPNLQCAKALKALTLHRMGKEPEATTILDQLSTENPSEDATLQAMTLCYRESQKPEKICEVYEAAVKLDPNNEELVTHLFMSYVRIFDFKSQQKTAMVLFKQKPKTPYYCWAVMSIVLQATRGEGRQDAKKRTLLLSLAERMMEKLILEGKLEAEQEVQLYVMVLELQDKFEEILTILDGPLGTKLACSNIPQNKIKYFKSFNRWEDINLVCKGILYESIDKWDIWKEYVGSTFKLMASKRPDSNNHLNHDGGDREETVDDSPDKCHEFICRSIEGGSENGFALRGPYLARFELCAKLLESNLEPAEVIGEPLELFAEYFRKFGHKPCCVSDLKVYLSILSREKRLELAAKLIKDVGISSTSVPQTEQQMQRHLCALQLSRLCGAHRNLSADHLKALATALSLHYHHGYQTYGSNLLSTDLGPSDPYALLAAHVLYDLGRIENSCEPIVTALVLLEALLKNSPSNFHAKLLSVRLYHTLGGTLGAHDMYTSLDTKHLQLDSLGFIHCARLPTSGLFSLASNLYDVTLKFFSSNYKDSSDHITFSYGYGTFIKLDEFMDFRERLSNSLHYTTAAIDKIILNLIECTTQEALFSLDISTKDDKIEWDQLRDNHDLSVYVGWDPERIDAAPESTEDVRLLFNQNVDFLKLRVAPLWALSAALDVARSTDGTRTNHTSTLVGLIHDWERLHDDILAKNYAPIRQDLVTLPLPSRLHVALETPHLYVIGGLLRIFSKVGTGTEDNAEIDSSIDNIESALKKFISDVTNRTGDESKKSDLIYRRHTLELIVNGVEMISLAIFVYLLCNALCRQSRNRQQPSKKGRNKKATEVLTSSSSSCDWFVRLCSLLRLFLEEFDRLVGDWSTSCAFVDLPKLLDGLNLNEDGKTVCDYVANSYGSVGVEVRSVLKSKLRLLQNVAVS